MASCLTLRQRLNQLGGDRPDQIPFLVWLLENPDSCFALPGCIDLHGHDCLHVLLQRGFSPYDEAFVPQRRTGLFQIISSPSTWVIGTEKGLPSGT
jgi:hypothetical protein